MPSKLKAVPDVPTMPATVSPTVPAMPPPTLPMHVTDVAVTHPAVLQPPSISRAVTVVSVGAKLMPVSVTLAASVTTLYGDTAVITGAGCHRSVEQHTFPKVQNTKKAQ
jgi:hypothetical protein